MLTKKLNASMLSPRPPASPRTASPRDAMWASSQAGLQKLQQEHLNKLR